MPIYRSPQSIRSGCWRRFAAITATLALGIVLAAAVPADAADSDPAPVTVISGPATNLDFPTGLVVAPDGTIYEAGEQDYAVNVFAPGDSGNAAPEFEITGQNTGLDAVYGLALDSVGDLWVVEFPDELIEFGPGANGDATPKAIISGSSTGLDGVLGVAIGPNGSVYASELGPSGNGAILVFDKGKSGNVAPSRTITGSTANLGGNDTWGIAVHADGSIVVARTSGEIETFAATADGDVAPIHTISGSNTNLDHPGFVALDAEGDIFTTSPDNNAVLEFASNADGNVAPLGQLIGASTELNYPWPIAIDRENNIYVGNANYPESITEYGATLALTGLTPASGSAVGGQTVTIHGYGFADGAAVTFDGIGATGVHVVSSTTITATVPAHAVGSVDVAVSQPQGANDGIVARLTNGYTYVASLPTTGVDPVPGLLGGTLLLGLGMLVLLVPQRRRRVHPALTSRR
jgi:hypothetical protein